MASKPSKEDLKKCLRQEVARFSEQDNRLWKKPVVEMLRQLQNASEQAVFFGGTLRSLLVSRLYNRRPGRPRDVDIVISGSTINGLKKLFQERIARETRFGGLQLRHWDWQFDVWPVERTWAFKNDSVLNAGFAALPETTFFNLEAIAVEVWPLPGKSRQIYSGNDQFFDGILNRRLEINLEKNPYPELCVVRALVLAAAIDFELGPKLSAYLSKHGTQLTIRDLDSIQIKHYGYIRQESKLLKNWILWVKELHSRSPEHPIRLPIQRQLTLWPDVVEPDTLRIHALSE